MIAMRSFITTSLFTVVLSASIFSANILAQGAGMMSSSPAINPAKTATTTVKADAAQTTKTDTTKSKVEQKTEKKGEKKAEKSEPQAEKAAAPVTALDDASVAKAVQEKLASLPSLKDTKINVVVKGGVATLTGTVKNAGLKGVATNAAKRIAGVKQVDNQIVAEKGIGK
jgi:osmotically-inducible protein OsmY